MATRTRTVGHSPFDRGVLLFAGPPARTRRLARYLVAAAVLGCHLEPVASQAMPRIVWPADSASVPATRIVGPPAFRVGSAAGADPTLFDGVTGVVRTAGRHLAVGDAGNNRVVFFDQTGRYVKTVGRVGDGPGEFRQQRWVGRCADGAVAVQDGAHASVVILEQSGEIRRTVPMPVDANFDQVLWGSGATGLFVELNRPRDEVTRGSYMEVPTALVRVTAGAVDTVMVSGQRDFYVGRAVAALAAVPLGREVLAAAGPRFIFVCGNDDGMCAVVDSAGARAGTFSLGLPRRPVAASDWAIAVRDHYQLEPSRRVRAAGARLLAEIKPRSQFPQIDQVFADDLDRLWVRTLDNYGTPWATWLLLNSTGKRVAMVALPRGLTPRAAGRDYLVTSSRDEDGVEYVEYFAISGLTKTAGAP